MNLLRIDSSALGDASVSRALTTAIVDAQRRADPAVRIVERDLTSAPPDHLTPQLIEVVKLGKTEGLDDRQRAEVALIDTLVGELLAADVVVIGAPMYNFGIPSQLKAWIDRIAQAGRTFSYGPDGPVGLATGKRVIIASSRGGQYAGKPIEQALDHQEAYLRAVLGFLGMTDVTVVRAEGLSMGPDVKTAAVNAALAQIDTLFLREAA